MRGRATRGDVAKAVFDEYTRMFEVSRRVASSHVIAYDAVPSALAWSPRLPTKAGLSARTASPSTTWSCFPSLTMLKAFTRPSSTSFTAAMTLLPCSLPCSVRCDDPLFFALVALTGLGPDCTLPAARHCSFYACTRPVTTSSSLSGCHSCIYQLSLLS